MRILVTGARGQLGQDLVAELDRRGHTPIGVDIEEMDITDPHSVEETLKTLAPEAVIHCAAWTAVDAAEEPENVERVRAVNALGTSYITEVCRAQNIPLLYISTDYVFDGEGEHPRLPDDPRNPISVYGKTKCEGEMAVQTWEKHFIVRIAWVFGVHGKNFVRTMLNLGKTRTHLTVVSDQVGSPTFTEDLSVLLSDMIVTDKYGIYHATNEGYCSWYDFACEIFRQAADLDPVYGNVTVSPVDSNAYPAKAKRPHNSRMSKDKLTENGFARLPAWQDALARYLTKTEV